MFQKLIFNSVLKRNVLANFGGKAWSGLIQLAFVPIYIKFLGIESYGLIGFFVVLQTVLSVLDLGLSTTLTRELALKSASNRAQDAKNLVRTMEWVYWSIAVLIALLITVASPWIANYWVNSNALPVHSLEKAITLMGFAIAAQWPYSLYSGGLIGLQKQVLLNVIRALMATVQAVGAVLVLWLVSSSIEVFFIWQIAVLGIQTMLTAYFLRSFVIRNFTCSNTEPAAFSWDLLHQTWKFSAGVAVISIASIILTQIDKIILSKTLSLDKFGLYMLVFTLSGALIFLATPVLTAIFPKLSALVAEEKTEELTELYHKACQIIALFVFPFGVLITLFSQEILMIWTQDILIAKDAHFLLSVVTIGFMLNITVSMPYILQLAHGWTSLAFYKNVIAITILIPTLFALVSYIGVIGGAITWVLLNLGYIIIEIPLMHSRLIRNDMAKWYIIDVTLPLLCCIFVGSFFRALLDLNDSYIELILMLTITLGSMFIATAFALPSSRAYFKEFKC